MTPRVLNLGCGHRHMSGAVNLDVTAVTRPDVVHDLDRRPWPFPSDSFDLVVAQDVIEHLHDVVKTMEEIHRVCCDGAAVRVTVPHFSCANAFRDITHRHCFSWYSFHYFTGEHEFAFYTDRRFARTRTDLVFRPTLLNKLVWRMAARWPDAYEQRWAWLFPAWFLHFELRVVK
jgi:SAM-dependent methyltransferase